MLIGHLPQPVIVINISTLFAVNLISHRINAFPPDMAEAAFYLCAYEFAIKTVNSPWCRLFDEVDAQVSTAILK